MRSKGTYVGKIRGFNVDYSGELHLELTDYDLPEFTMYTDSTPAIGVFFVTLGLTFITLVVYRRKKKH